MPARVSDAQENPSRDATTGVRLALLRHGRTAWNRAHKLQGRSDQPLDAEGAAEIRARALPSDWRSAKLVASPLQRAKHTAELLAEGAPVTTDPRLIEMDFGDWEGRRGADLIDDRASGYRHVEDWGWSFQPPNGEPLTALRNRVSAFLQDVGRRCDRDGAAAIAVCHIGVMRVALALAHDWRFTGPPPFQIKRARLYPLRVDPMGRPSPDGPPIRLPERAGAGPDGAPPCA